MFFWRAFAKKDKESVDAEKAAGFDGIKATNSKAVNTLTTPFWEKKSIDHVVILNLDSLQPVSAICLRGSILGSFMWSSAKSMMVYKTPEEQVESFRNAKKGWFRFKKAEELLAVLNLYNKNQHVGENKHQKNRSWSLQNHDTIWGFFLSGSHNEKTLWRRIRDASVSGGLEQRVREGHESLRRFLVSIRATLGPAHNAPNDTIFY